MVKKSEYHNPLLYPWTPPAHSGLMVDDQFFGFEDMSDDFGRSVLSGTGRQLDALLISNGLAPVSRRHLVVAVGANASPAAMSQKMKGGFGYSQPIVPFVKITVSNLAVGHAGYATARGYIPATPYHEDGAETVLWGSYLDDDQLETLDLTEPNYNRLKVSVADYPVVMDNGATIDHFYLYDTYRGVLSTQDGTVIPLSTQEALHVALADVELLAERFSDTPECNISRFPRSKTCPDIDSMFMDAGLLKQTGVKFVEKHDIEAAFFRKSSSPSIEDIMREEENLYSVLMDDYFLDDRNYPDDDDFFRTNGYPSEDEVWWNDDQDPSFRTA